jgi:hypothetical protein
MADEQPAPAPAARPDPAKKVEKPAPSDSDVVLVYRHKTVAAGKRLTVQGPSGPLPQGDITRGEAPRLLQHQGWAAAVLASDVYALPDGTTLADLDLPKAPAAGTPASD